MKHITALFTAVSGWPTHATVAALRKSTIANYTVIGVDCTPNVGSLNYVDYLYKVPKCNEPEYIPTLLEICHKHNVDIIIPLISEDIPPLWEHMDEIKAEGISILLSNKSSLLPIANDKELLENYLTENGVHVMPKTIKFRDESLAADLEKMGYPNKPIALKLKDACGGIGFKILDEKKAKGINGMSSREARVNPYVSLEQVKKFPDELKKRYIIQEYLPGREMGTLCLVDNGRTIYSPSHDNYEMQYATTTDCELVNNEEANKIVREINSMLRLDGNIGYDFKRDAEGHLRLLEINPRISATVSLAVKAGLNIVEMGVLHALGCTIDENVVPMYGMRMQRVYGTLYTYKGEPYGNG